MTDSRFLTIIESPYAGQVLANEAYARHCLRDSILRGETPFASHLLYTQHGVLRDGDAEERELGMALGFRFYGAALQCAVYGDRGISPGMARGIAHAAAMGIPTVYRSLFVVPIPPIPTSATETAPQQQ